ncbi:efflux transporter outer membrane subunit [Trinickia symbiotica]|uniref:RND transporter n=1 Tax=Trinickia symbiotica TaxID=863227 RepID=A0A2N7X0F9_9BURK|nr:efflux transporter outer membrane subunit [Trinickia symbiotica]PMS35238.1 RND transporter [Trinickia symbiotica]
MKFVRTPIVLALALALGACAVGPDYRRPAVAVPTKFKELDGWTQAQPAAEASKGDWWTVFHDPLLDELEPMVVVSNQTVRQDYANYEEALAEVRVARASLFPSIGVTGSATRERSSTGSSSSSLSASNFSVSRRNVNNSASLEGSVSWAPDLWGQVRRTVEENAASAQASQATLANATLSEQVTLATAVIDLRITDANIDLLTKTVENYKEYLRVVSDQAQAGTEPPSDLITAKTQLESAQSSLIALGVSRAQYEHAIAVLVGKNPEDLDISHSTSMPVLPSIPVGVPSTLLQRRPDIAVAEREMAAQNAAIGVAVSAYYPTISLSAAAGFSASPLAGLLNIGNYVWSLGADVSQTLFDGGERSGKVAAAKAAYDAAVANYRGTVLTAFEGVDNDLAGLRILGEQAKVLDAEVKDATRGAQIALDEYQAGTVDYTTVATAQTTLLSAQETALGVEQTRLVDAVSLIGDLGGGWSADALCDPRHAKCEAPASGNSGASAPAASAPASSNASAERSPLHASR